MRFRQDTVSILLVRKDLQVSVLKFKEPKSYTQQQEQEQKYHTVRTRIHQFCFFPNNDLEVRRFV